LGFPKGKWASFFSRVCERSQHPSV
jgi:hypothetical protein